jgi:TRAP-type C4-dicarboxylate transport system substrate-binding protein
MTARTRRNVLKAAALGAASLAAPAIVRAQARRRVLKPLVAGLNAKEGDPTFESISRIGAILRDKHGVDIDIQIHPGSTLGNDLQQIEAVQVGLIDITSNVTLQFASFSDAFAFVDLPYAITSWDMYARLPKSALWKRQAAKFEAKTPLKVLPPVGSGGFRVLWNNQRALPAPAALKGLKLRTTNSPLEIDLMRGWGASPTPLAWTKTYNALSSGAVEGIHVQPIWTYRFNMHEHLKYGTRVDAIFAVQFQVMNANTWRSLPPDVQAAFWAAAEEAADEANAHDREAESGFAAKLAQAGLQIYAPSAAERAQWQRIGEGLWQDAKVDPDVVKAMTALR